MLSNRLLSFNQYWKEQAEIREKIGPIDLHILSPPRKYTFFQAQGPWARMCYTISQKETLNEFQNFEKDLQSIF